MWLTCDCFHHALCINEIEDAITLSFWRYGNYEDGLRGRLRHIWYILKHGHPYADQLVFRNDAARDLADHIYEIVGGRDMTKEVKVYGAWAEDGEYWYVPYNSKYSYWSLRAEEIQGWLDRVGDSMSGYEVKEMPEYVVAQIPEAAAAVIAIYKVREAKAMCLLAEGT